MDDADRVDPWAHRAVEVDGDPYRAVALAIQLGRSAPRPGGGDTPALFELLTALGRSDLTAARVVEAHLDARSILGEAGHDAQAGAWGVFAAEAPGVRLEADEVDGGFVLSGTKPWCSLAGILDRALVTAHTNGGHRRLFEVDLRAPGVDVRSGEWVALGLQGVPSGSVEFARVAASPVGADGWYLDRPGFSWGGIGVAACWLGGAEGLARRLWSAAHSANRDPDQIALMHLGAVDAQLFAARVVLADAGRRIDEGLAVGQEGKLLAARTRIVVANVVEDVLRRAAHSLGPAPLALEPEHARRVADLELYVRQHHAERDDASLGRRLLEGERPW